MARLIRGWGASSVSPRAVRDAKTLADAILADAEAAARARASEAERAAAMLRVEAEEEGRREGNAKVAALIAATRAERDRALGEARREIVTLAIAVAKRLVGDAVERDARVVESIARDAIERARGSSRLRILVAPADAPALAALASAHLIPLEVEPDPTLGRGDCVVRADVGTIDARLDTKLAAFLDALLGELDRA
jgi:flagellar biosynthesis/type III secretory pathway protein FliH